MYKKIIEKLQNKKIAILGFGREGRSTYGFIRKYMQDIPLYILDQNDFDIEDINVTKIVGEKYLDNMEQYDLIIKTPGISLKNMNIDNIRHKITSQLELLLEVNRKNIIGITGTKGKSTTSSLLYEVIKKQKKDTYLVGNIGVPVLDEIEKYHEDTTLVIEMSSHQLEYIKVSPHIAIILNLYEDHLDHDGTLEHYHNNKMNIFKYQSKTDHAIYASDNKYLSEKIRQGSYQAIMHTVRFDNTQNSINATRIEDNNVYIDGKLVYTDSKRLLLGDHNLKNIMFVLTVCSILKLDFEQAKEVINSFKGLKYRMEYIGTFHDIKYYNDTIATIPEATESAISAIGDVDTLICGGLDRGISYEEFIHFLIKSNVANIICMPTTGNYIASRLNNTDKKVYYAKTLEEAYNISRSCTTKGKSCILSPAAASYEFFKNFEEKGKKFEEIVRNS